MPEHKDDIEKYLRGELSSAERHRLEKKALSDPFLAEALEGGAVISGQEFSEDLNLIRQKINSPKSNSLFWPLSIAAGIVVIISITLVTIQFTKNETDNQLALQKLNPSGEKHLPLNETSADPSKEISSARQTEQQTPTSEKARDLLNQPVISEAPQAAGAERNTDTPSSVPTQTEELQETEAPKETADDKIKEQAELAKVGESDDKKNAPSKNDRAAAAPPPATRSLALSKKSEAPSGAGIARDDLQPSVVESGPPAFTMPVGGMSGFDKYVEDHLHYPQAARSNNIQGDVIIEFQINANGSYRNFEIIKSLGFGCDEEAVRLINEGPPWKPAIQDGKVIDNKPRVTISFRSKKDK